MASCIKFGVEGVGQALSFVDASGSGPQPLICPVAHKEMRGVSSWVLGATAVAMALMVATTSAGDLEDDIEGLWESTGGDIMRKLVTDMENDAVAAGRKMVRAAASMGGKLQKIRAVRRVCRRAARPTRQLADFRHRLARYYFLR